MKLFIKNMVSNSCIVLVKSELEKLCIPYTNVRLGEIEIDGNLSSKLYNQTMQALKTLGFDILQTSNEILTERIKNVIVELIHHTEDELKFNFSNYLSSKLNLNYTYLSNLFAKEQGVSIRDYIIAQRIELVKELMSYDELNLSEIAYRAHYSSAAHLSNQFKKLMGITPSTYKKMNDKMLVPLEQVGIAV